MNPDLTCLLDQRCRVLRPTESVVNMVTKHVFAKTANVAVHVQAKTDHEMAYGFGYEEEGDYWGFFHSTQDVRTGDLIDTTSGPHVGKRFWLRGRPTVTDVPGIEHIMANLEFTEDST